jgi:anaerobic selenocysteine-containing dehydrogenase
MLDRRRGPDPPRMLAVDPRSTPVTREADIHLAVRPGTNQALLNAILHEVIAHGWHDRAYVEAHTLGFEALERTVADFTPERAAAICDVDARLIRDAAELVGTCRALFSSVLQGFYQSHQATAASCQVNNLHLLRGMIGRPGAGICQMNGQPTAQNTRETGADGDLPGMRNWDNPAHIEELAALWNVEPSVIPHWAPPTHAMQIWRYAEQGSIRLLWISATNPAVSLPELHRIRKILAREELFVVVQDLFRTETAEFADVVLPAAGWAEKTGTLTNADRTVHLSEQAIDRPGEARSDLDIFLEYARRMGFRNREGGPLITWTDPESAFEAWKACSKGRPCDYSGLSYEQLRGGSGIQWPCTEAAPRGTERLYAGGRFNTESEYAETFGQDLLTGAAHTETEYRALEPGGRAFLHAAPFTPPPEEPSDEYPYRLTTGRTLFQFHTGTKTARAPQLKAAAPDVWVELSAGDAAALGVGEGDVLRVRTRRGSLEAPVRVSGIRDGVIFVPFHYGYWDQGDDAERAGRAANELTMTRWDPVSSQPMFKAGAARLELVARATGAPAPAPTNTGSKPVAGAGIADTAGGESAMATSTAEGH